MYFTKKGVGSLGKVTSLNKVRAKKQRKKLLKKLSGLLGLIIVIVGGTYLFSSYTPSQLMNIIGDFFSGNSGNGYPIEAPVNNLKGVYDRNDSLLVASDTYLYDYNITAKKTMQIKHDLQSPSIEIDGGYILLYDRLTNQSVVYKGKDIYSNTKAEEPIFSADINKRGEVAIATSSKKYQSVVNVSEKNFVWNSPTKIINKVELDNNSDYLCASGIETEDGQIISSVVLLDTTKTEPVFETKLKNQIVLDISFKNSAVEVITDTQGILYSFKGSQIKEYSFDDRPLKFFDMNDQKSLYAFGDFEKQGYIELTCLSNNYKQLGNKKIKKNIVQAKLTNKFVVLLTNNSIEIYDHSFTKHKTILAKDVYKIQPVGNMLYLISKDFIEQVSLSI